MTLARRSAKLRRQRTHTITTLYGSLHFSASRHAIRLYKAVQWRLIPPVVANTAGTNEACSTSRIRCSYMYFKIHVLQDTCTSSYIDKKSNFDLVSLDFCKALDRVNHSTLLDQIGRFSDPKVTAWIRSYLQDREIAVEVGSCTSLPKITNCGVPQGSHLSTLLFLIYINDLPTTIMHSHTFLFADDVTLLHPYEHTPSSPVLQADIQACQTWARARGGEFSPSKTSVISYSYKSVSPSTAAAYQIDGAPLNGTDVLKHLGIRFTANLNFHQHYIDMSGKFKQRITLLCYMAQRLTPKAMMLLYKSYV